MHVRVVAVVDMAAAESVAVSVAVAGDGVVIM